MAADSGQTRTLTQLGLSALGGRDAQITGIAVDSREVRDGFLFAAMPGTRVHGGEFIQYALRQGAAAILTDSEGARIAEAALSDSTAALVIAEDPRQALAGTAALWFGTQPRVMAAGAAVVKVVEREVFEPLPEPVATVAAEVVPLHAGITLDELKASSCRWPVGDPSGENFRFCGARTGPTDTYCTAHADLAFPGRNKPKK